MWDGVGWGGWGGGLGVIIESNLNQVRLSCCLVGVGLGCDNYSFVQMCRRMETTSYVLGTLAKV